VHDVTLFVPVHSTMCRYCSITSSVIVHFPTVLFVRNVDSTFDGNIETLSLEMRI